MLGNGRAWKGSIEFVGYRLPQHEENGCTIDQSLSGFSDILIGCLHIRILVRVAKICFWHASVCNYLWNVLATFYRKSVRCAYHLNLLEVDVFLPKSNARFKLVKIHKQWDYLAVRNCKPMEKQDLLASMNVSRFPGKSIALQHVLHLTVTFEEKDTKTGENSQRQWTTRGKGSKASKGTNKHDNESKYRQLGWATEIAFVALRKAFLLLPPGLRLSGRPSIYPRRARSNVYRTRS